MNSLTDAIIEGDKSEGISKRIWQEIGLIAIPILVICVAVAFSPPSSKGFWSTIISKPEWYFLALVLCIEAHRDLARIDKRSRRTDDLGIIFLALAAVLAGLAAFFSITNAPAAPSQVADALTAPPFFDRMWNVLVNNPLHFFSIPIFLFSAFWSAWCKQQLREEEDREAEENRLLLDIRRPRIYSVDHRDAVINFYDTVASEYNKRNDKTKGIRNAQDQIIDEIRSLVKKCPAGRVIDVLDLGGGTGHNLYNALRSEDNLSWISLDLSPGMTDKFRTNFPTAKALTGDCLELSSCLGGEPNTYDAIVLSFALSSMPRNVDFAALSKYLKPGGCILVADIHPGYVAKSPCFDIDIGSQSHALKLRKVEPLILEHEALSHSLLRTEWKIFENERREVYSFFIKFKK